MNDAVFDEAAGAEAALRWFVAATLPQKEAVAQENLKLQGFLPFCPLEQVVRRHARRSIRVNAPVFRGYIFLRMNPAEARWRAVNGTRGVRSLLTDGNGPLPVRSGVVETLLQSTDSGGLLHYADPLQPGVTVRLRSGPFAEQLGVIERLDGARRVQLLMEFLGRPVRAEVERNNVLKVA